MKVGFSPKLDWYPLYVIHLVCQIVKKQLWLDFALLSIEQVIAGLDRAVATMKKGEQAILTIHPDFGFGSSEVRRDLSVIPPSSNVVYEVEMLNFFKVIIILIKF